ncbi:hypothetical protein, partial [Escherichia coli]|uniref:hypothetical protein n=1 Tax=Escherichia coli TaxID=562 RepID=UPI001FCEFB17
GFKFRRLTGISRGAGPVMEWDDTDLETKGLEYEFKYLYEIIKAKENCLLQVTICQIYLMKSMVSVFITNMMN